MQFDVLLLGEYFCDLIFTGLPHLPVMGAEIYGSGFEMMPGGSYNSAVALHRLGLRVGWACDFGDDFFSRFILDCARAEGIDGSLFCHHERPLRRITVAASFPGDRAFMSFADPPATESARLRALKNASARLIYFPGLTFGPLFEAGHAAAWANGAKIAMDCQHTVETLRNAGARRAVSRVDLFTPNATEARQLTGAEALEEAMTRLAELCPLVVVKDGVAGAHAALDGRIIHSPALAVEAVDTTGAGDCFDAGFLKAWLDGQPIEECLRWGNVCGGLSTTAVGGATGAPRLAEVRKHL